MKQRIKDICNITRYGTETTIIINNRIFTSPQFQEQQDALERLKQDPELDIIETTHTKYKLKPYTTRTITIKVKQKRNLHRTPKEKHQRIKRGPLNKPNYNWSIKPYLRIKDPETMKRIKANKILRKNRSQMIFP